MYRVLTLTAAAVVATVTALPASAQSVAEQRAWEAAQRRYDNETAIYNRARDNYERAQRRDRRYGYNNGGYNNGYNNGYPDGQYATDYDASRYYRDGPQYQERVLTNNDQVYRGSDGRYYCKRSDGTTGLIIGGAAGGIIGNVIDGGRNRVAGTLIGGALGAIIGKKTDQANSEYRCR